MAQRVPVPNGQPGAATDPRDLVVDLAIGPRVLVVPAQDVAFGAGKIVEVIHCLCPAAQVLLIAPPPITESGCLAEMFGGGAAKSARFASLMATEATRKGAHFFDAGAHIAVDPLDGIHYATATHHTLGRAVAAHIRRLWP